MADRGTGKTDSGPHSMQAALMDTQQREMDLDAAAQSADGATRAIVFGFRDLLLHRAEKHVTTLAQAHEQSAQVLQGKLQDASDHVMEAFNKFVTETLQHLESERKKLENDTGQIVNDIQKLRDDVNKRSQELKDATEKWEEQHKRTFQGLDKFQKEYRDMIHELDSASKRMEKVVEGSKLTSISTVIAIFVAGFLGSSLAYLVLSKF